MHFCTNLTECSFHSGRTVVGLRIFSHGQAFREGQAKECSLYSAEQNVTLNTLMSVELIFLLKSIRRCLFRLSHVVFIKYSYVASVHCIHFE